MRQIRYLRHKTLDRSFEDTRRSLAKHRRSGRGTGRAAGANGPPTVTLPATATFTGTVYDGSNTAASVTVTWNEISGPATVSFTSPTGDPLTATAQFSAPDDYVVGITATDETQTANAQASITVLPALVPVASAGPPQTITAPTLTATLTRSATEPTPSSARGTRAGRRDCRR